MERRPCSAPNPCPALSLSHAPEDETASRSRGGSDVGPMRWGDGENGSRPALVRPQRGLRDTLLRSMSPTRTSPATSPGAGHSTLSASVSLLSQVCASSSLHRAPKSPLPLSDFDSEDGPSPVLLSPTAIRSPTTRSFSPYQSPASRLNALHWSAPVHSVTSCRIPGMPRNLHADSSGDLPEFSRSNSLVEEMLHGLGTGPLARRGLMTLGMKFPYLITSA